MQVVRTLAWGLAIALLGCGPAGERAGEAASGSVTGSPIASAAQTNADPAEAKGRFEATSLAGRFRIAIRPEAGPRPIGELHAWLVEVKQADGRAVELRQLSFDGGMPQHAHGFETSPRVTEALGPGVYRVDGVRFHMAGAWKIRVDVLAADGPPDVAWFDVAIGP